MERMHQEDKPISGHAERRYYEHVRLLHKYMGYEAWPNREEASDDLVAYHLAMAMYWHEWHEYLEGE